MFPEFYPVAFRKEIYRTLEELQANTERAKVLLNAQDPRHDRRGSCGCSQTLLIQPPFSWLSAMNSLDIASLWLSGTPYSNSKMFLTTKRLGIQSVAIKAS